MAVTELRIGYLRTSIKVLTEPATTLKWVYLIRAGFGLTKLSDCFLPER